MYVSSIYYSINSAVDCAECVHGTHVPPAMAARKCCCNRPGCPIAPVIDASDCFNVTGQVDAAQVTVIRGQQGTADWHRQRYGSIGASTVKNVVTASNTNVKINHSRRIMRCLEVSQQLTSKAITHGHIHEPVARAAYLAEAKGPGIVAEQYKGSLCRTSDDLGKKKAWRQKLQPLQLLAPRLKLDTGVQVVRNSMLWHSFASPDALAYNPDDGAVWFFEIKCPQADSWPLSAAEYLFSGSSGRPHWDYIMQMMQQRAMLGPDAADYVDFVKWAPAAETAELNSSDLGNMSVLRVFITMEDYQQVVFGKAHAMASHYLWPLQEWVNQRPNFPPFDTPDGEYSRVAEFNKLTPRAAVCSCGGDRICYGAGCLEECTCRCVILCGQPLQHAVSCECLKEYVQQAAANAHTPASARSGGTSAAAATGPSQPRRTRSSFSWSPQQEGCLEQEWAMHMADMLCDMLSNTKRHLSLSWRKQLVSQLNSLDGAKADPQRVQQWLTKKAAEYFTYAAGQWQPNALQLSILQVQFPESSVPYTKKAGHDALTALQQAGLVTNDISELYINSWYIRSGGQPAAGGTAASRGRSNASALAGNRASGSGGIRVARSRPGASGDDGEGKQKAWYIRHPRALTGLRKAVQEYQQLPLQEQHRQEAQQQQQQHAMAVPEQAQAQASALEEYKQWQQQQKARAAAIVKHMKQSNNQEIRTAVGTVKLTAANVGTVLRKYDWHN